MILREAIRHEALAKLILYSPVYYNFYDYVELSTFDVASDAFTTFKELMTKHKVIVADFLHAKYDEVFAKYTGLLNSSNYVTKRQSIKVWRRFFVAFSRVSNAINAAAWRDPARPRQL